ncbi:ribonucleotide reductase inhibitor-domain-containing protein [Aspergillus californicus]
MPPTTTDLSKRRRFQPPITTFFNTSSDSNPNFSPLTHNHYAAATYSPTPVVSAKDQSSLLSVGMRIRKSVAEGYKTNHAKTTYIPKPKFVAEEHKRTVIETTYSTQARFELAPFSGMAKPNEHAIQPLPRPADSGYTHDIITTDEDDAFSLPPSSQESVSSSSDIPAEIPTPAAIAGQRKRTLQDFTTYEDGDRDGDEYYGFEETTDIPQWQHPLHLHPLSSTASTTRGRTILSPTLNQQRRRFVAAHKRKISTPMSTTMDLDDFEEPAFLRRREEVDNEYDAEVQMGGM